MYGLGFWWNFMYTQWVDKHHNGDYEYSTARNDAQHGKLSRFTLLLLYSESLECWVLKLQTTAVAVESMDFTPSLPWCSSRNKKICWGNLGTHSQQWEIGGFWFLQIGFGDFFVLNFLLFILFFGSSQKPPFPPDPCAISPFLPSLVIRISPQTPLRTSIFLFTWLHWIPAREAPQCSTTPYLRMKSLNFLENFGEVDGAEHTVSTSGSIKLWDTKLAWQLWSVQIFRACLISILQEKNTLETPVRITNSIPFLSARGSRPGGFHRWDRIALEIWNANLRI